MAHDEHGLSHVMSIPMLVGVWAALMFLTVVTVMSAQYDLGALDLPVAMGIATIKALLVALFFMHLKYDRPFNGLIFMASVVFAGVFVTIAMMDTGQNQDEIRARVLIEESEAQG
ncbi:MAG: cytochrome C oxidase subunit IV family protein [Planctomycetota bacterium]|jgi:cytochrome c oxidase subunit 4